MNDQNENRRPEWMKPAGWVALIVGGLTLLATANLGGGTTHLEAAIFSGALNPLFFAGVPLALYASSVAASPTAM
jgi:hypothetical protein